MSLTVLLRRPLLLVLALAWQLPAQTPLTLPEAVIQARTAGPRRDVPGAHRALTVGTQRVGTQFPNPIFEYRRENGGSLLPPDEFFTVTVPVDVTGRRIALLQARSIAGRRAAADSAASALAQDLATAEAWVTAALTAELAQVATEQAAALDSLAAFDSLRFAAGAVAEVATLRTRVEADRAFVHAAAAQAAAARARAALAVWLGSVPLAIAPLSSVSFSAPPARDIVVSMARESRPDARAARAAADQLAARRRAEQRGLFSDIQLVGGTKNTSGFTNTAVIGVLMPVPLFNVNTGARNVADAEWRIATAEAAAAQIRAVADAHAAYEAWEALAARGSAARSLSARAADVASIARAAYREGATTLTAVLEAQRAAADVRAAAAEGTAARVRADIELRSAAGRGPLDPWTTP